MGVDAAASRSVEDAAWPHAASALLVSLTAAAAALTGLALARVDPGTVDWTAFAVFAVGAALAHGLATESVRGWSFRPTGVFVVAALILLPAGLAAVVALSAFVVAYLRVRRELRKQLFNAANHAFAALLAAGALHALDNVDAALADAAACLVFVVVADVLVAVMIGFAEARPVRETRLLEPAAFATALGLAGLGVVTATAWAADPWLLPFALAPLAVVHQALRLPHLVEESALDPKTKLYNAHRFTEALEELSRRAVRERTPLAVVMADLDLLREINNTRGHLAGDAVLRDVAEVIRSSVRTDDFAARFGGEEFAIILPDAGP
ncbi:MAG: diguanylate cyclase, partial [Gaiellaceae bacterium]